MIYPPKPRTEPPFAKPELCNSCILQSKGKGFAFPEGGFAKEVMFVGEALVQQEAATGKVFQGLAGWQLNMLLARAGLTRDDIFVENVIHCQPPNNRLNHASYEFDAINHCRPFLDESIKRLKPKAYVALGNIPMRRLISKLDITRNRGFVFDGPNGIPVIPTFHPSYLLPRRGQRSSSKWTGPVISDIRKAIRLAKDGFTRREPVYLLDPQPEQAWRFVDEYESFDWPYLSWDIETPYKINGDETDLEEGDGSEILRISFCFKVGYAMSIPWQAPWMPIIERLLTCNRAMVGWNAKAFDVPKVVEAGIEIVGDIHDGMNMFHVWLPNLIKKLEFVTSLCSDHIQAWKHLNIAKPALYNCIDSDAALENVLHIEKVLRRQVI